eukprot:1195164-Prorocentrum_minimum.AAC.6
MSARGELADGGGKLTSHANLLRELTTALPQVTLLRAALATALPGSPQAAEAVAWVTFLAARLGACTRPLRCAARECLRLILAPDRPSPVGGEPAEEHWLEAAAASPLGPQVRSGTVASGSREV